MTSWDGARKILRFNWPWYAGALSTTVAGVALIGSGTLSGRWATVSLGAVLAADFWLLASLLASHYVYDRSPVSRGGWLHGVEIASVRRAAVFHGGHDEASTTAARLLPSAALQTFDFYDPATKGTPSLRRARAAAQTRDPAIAADKIPSDDGVFDLCLAVFAAHEIRDDAARAAFFRELARITTPKGRVLVVEHLRDGWNFAAYGPGSFHFLSRRTWMRSFADGGLKLLRETTCTPFVRVFELGSAI